MGHLLVTEDGGVTWAEQPMGLDKTLFGLYFADGQRGWAVGIDALILHTDDGGGTWQVQNGSTEIRELEQVGFAQAYDNPSLYSIAVVDQNGFAVGEIGAVFLSTDGGRTWTRRETGKGQKEGVWFRAVSVVSGTHGAIVGAKGQRLMINDGQVRPPAEVSRAPKAIH